MIRNRWRGLLTPRSTRSGSEKGTALIETAMVLPLVLLVSVGIFEFGHAFQTWQILTNAAREGARVAVLSGSTDATVTARVEEYLSAGLVGNSETAEVTIDRDVTISGTTGTATTVTVTLPFDFMVLQPVVNLVVSGSTVGESITMEAEATMRNET